MSNDLSQSCPAAPSQSGRLTRHCYHETERSREGRMLCLAEGFPDHLLTREEECCRCHQARTRRRVYEPPPGHGSHSPRREWVGRWHEVQVVPRVPVRERLRALWRRWRAAGAQEIAR